MKKSKNNFMTLFAGVFMIAAFCPAIANDQADPSQQEPLQQEKSDQDVSSSEDLTKNETDIKSFIDNDYFQGLEELNVENPREKIEERIKELELNYGAFYPEISDELLALGIVYRSQEKYQLAYDALKRSLEIKRVNSGLYNQNQFPIVRELIITSSAYGKWGNVDRYFEYMYWLHRRVFDRNSPEMLFFLEEFIRWKIEALNRRLAGNVEAFLTDTQNAVRKYNNILKENPEFAREPIDLRLPSRFSQQ